MNRLLDRRNALRAGFFAVAGLGFLPREAEANVEKESQNKAIVGRWFTEFWGKAYNPAIVDALASPSMLLKYSLHKPRHGREDIKAFMEGFRAAFPDLNFWGTAPVIAEDDYVVGQWEGGGTHTGPAFSDFLAGSLPPESGRKIHFTGMTVLRLDNGTKNAQKQASRTRKKSAVCEAEAPASPSVNSLETNLITSCRSREKSRGINKL